MTVELSRTTTWRCGDCGFADQTVEARPHSRYHDCPAHANLAWPMVADGTTVKITRSEREDYAGDERLTQLDGRPIMSVVTEHRDGSNDVAVFAPVATARGGA